MGDADVYAGRPRIGRPPLGREAHSRYEEDLAAVRVKTYSGRCAWQIAADLGKSARTVQRYRAELRRRGLLS